MKSINNYPLQNTSYYRIKQTDFNGGYSYSEIRQVVFGKGQVGVNIYPNPAKDVINIECANAKEVLIIDYLGKVIKQQGVISEKVLLNVNDLTKGVYIAKITQHNGQSITKTFLIE